VLVASFFVSPGGDCWLVLPTVPFFISDRFCNWLEERFRSRIYTAGISCNLEVWTVTVPVACFFVSPGGTVGRLPIVI
jgi:hypothetical protein